MSVCGATWGSLRRKLDFPGNLRRRSCKESSRFVNSNKTEVDPKLMSFLVGLDQGRETVASVQSQVPRKLREKANRDEIIRLAPSDLLV